MCSTGRTRRGCAAARIGVRGLELFGHPAHDGWGFGRRILTPPQISPSPRDAGAGRGPGRGAILERNGPPLPDSLLPRREEKERAGHVLGQCQDTPGFARRCNSLLPCWMGSLHNRAVRINPKTTLLAALLPALALLGAGCSGINTSHSVSPATFLLPGFFGQAQPQDAPCAEPASAAAADSAQALAPAN